MKHDPRLPGRTRCRLRLTAALLAILAMFSVTQVAANAENEALVEEREPSTEDLAGPLPAADTLPGSEESGFGNTYVLLDSTDNNGPTYSDIYSPSNDTGLSDNDNSFVQAPLGFAFSFYGVDYANVYIGTNGYLTFTAGDTSRANEGLAIDTSPSVGGVFAWFDDLDYVNSIGAWIRYETYGAPGQRVFVVEYLSDHDDLGNGNHINFDVRLFEANDRIEVHYHDVSFGDAGYDSGISATTGIRSGNAGTAYLEYSFNTADIDAGMAIRYWLPTCNGQEVTWSGTRGNDWYGGNAADEVVYGHHGADILYGWDGNDLICGGEGADEIYGQDGNDTVYGSLGGDLIEGGTGNDWLYGGGGNDSLYGQSGIDYLYGQAQNDTLDGGGGADFMYGSTGADTLNGGTGDDLVNGGAGIDILNAGGDDDMVIGGGGADTINGGSGNDILRGGGGDDLIEGYDGADVMSGGGGNDTMLGYAGDDRMTGGPGNDSLNGGAGEDNMTGNGGDDNMNGSTDEDIIVGSGGNDIMNGSTGIDYMYGGPGNDTVNGGGDDDFLYGNGNDDTLTGGGGYNSLDGGGGTDSCNYGVSGTTIRCEP